MSPLRKNAADGSVAAGEPCLTCGEKTEIGTVFYSDRRSVALPDGRTVYLCSLCDSRLRLEVRGRPERLTDEQVASVALTGFAAGAAYAKTF